MADGMTVGSIHANPGEKQFGRLPVCRLASGAMLELPVHLVVGAQPGPTLGILALQHGNEVQSLGVLRQFLHRVNPATMRGNLAVLPVANPIAFEHDTRSSWIDALYGNGGNLNQLWPGRPDGFIAEKICFTIHTEFMPVLDAVIDLHGIVTGQLVLYYGFIVGGPEELAAKNRALSEMLGLEIILRRSVKPTSFSDYAVRERKIPAVACELGEFYGFALDGKTDRRERARRLPEVGVTALTNIAKHLGILEGAPVLPPRQVIVSPETNVRATQGGLLLPDITPRDIGTVLSKGTLLGTVIDPFSLEVLEEIVTPFERNIVIATPEDRPCLRINTGDFGYLVADWDTAEWVEH